MRCSSSGRSDWGCRARVRACSSRSVLLWHRSDNIAFVLILGGASAVNVGTGLECKIKGVLQASRRANCTRCSTPRTSPRNQQCGLKCGRGGALPGPQVIDEVKGPVTKKEFELFEVPVGDALFGRTLNFLGQPLFGGGGAAAAALPADPVPEPQRGSESAPAASSSGGSSKASPVPQRDGGAAAAAAGGPSGKKRSPGGAEKLRPLLNAQVRAGLLATPP